MEPTSAVVRGLLATAPDALLAVDLQGAIVYMNDQVERLFGWTRDELIGRPVECLVPERFAARHPGLRAGYVLHPVSRPMGAGLELWARRKDGSEFPAEISLSSFDTETGQLMAAAIRDVTDRIDLENERLKLSLEAQREQSHRLESLGQLAGGVAHDFNNLLGVILNYATLISRTIEDPAVESDLKEIRAAAERGAALTRQLLTFARRDVVNAEPVEVADVIRGVVSMLVRTLGEHSALELHLVERPTVTVADRHQLEQILLNLTINARDAMPDGGVLTISTEVGPGRGESMEQDVIIRVADTGTGMSAEVMARAFEPFFTTKDRAQGSGLGLATVYGIARSSGGVATLESSIGSGTTVTIRLPASAEAVASSGPDQLHSLGGRERILLVEDEEPLRVGTARLLRSHGYDLVVASDGVEALEVIERFGESLSLVLTDVVMPQMRGDELAARLADLGYRIPVVFMSGYDSSGIPMAGILLPKPVGEETLLRTIREVLDG